MNYTEIITTLTDSMHAIAKQIGETLPFNKTYSGKITGKDNRLYTVEIHKKPYKISSEFDFDINTNVKITAIQNNFNQLYLEPNQSAIKNAGISLTDSDIGVLTVNGQTGHVSIVTPLTITMTDPGQNSNPLAVIKANWSSMPDGCYTAAIHCGTFYGATIQRLNNGDYGSVQIIGYTLTAPLYYRCNQGIWS